jgi:hypothetical protein
MPKAPIVKSPGVTPTERLLAELCERSFLRLWSYPNPYKDDGKEFCDLLAVFEDHVFIFFDRESRHLKVEGKNKKLAWERWKRAAIEDQVRTAHGAERYLRSGRKIFLDAEQTTEFPIAIDRDKMIVHRIVVAHGAAEACQAFSDANVYGSLAVTYGKPGVDPSWPFLVEIDKDQPFHLLDSHNLPIILGELDTIFDLSSYLDAKLEAIRRYDGLMYCGEEDLLAHYFLNFDEAKNLAPALRVVGVGGDRRARRNCTPWHGYGATAERRASDTGLKSPRCAPKTSAFQLMSWKRERPCSSSAQSSPSMTHEPSTF